MSNPDDTYFKNPYKRNVLKTSIYKSTDKQYTIHLPIQIFMNYLTNGRINIVKHEFGRYIVLNSINTQRRLKPLKGKIMKIVKSLHVTMK